MTRRASVPRWLKLQAEIDYLYFLLGQHHEQMPTLSLDALIDDATGATKARTKSVRDIARRMKRLKEKWSLETGLNANTEMEEKILALIEP